MLHLKNGLDPWLIEPGVPITELVEDTATLPKYNGTVTVASRGNLGGTLDYTYDGEYPVWCLGILNLKAKQVSLQSVAFRMLFGSMSVAECTLDYDTGIYVMMAQTRYLNPVLVQKGMKVTIGIWTSSNGSPVTNLDGNCEIRLFGRM
jgi:hypothetical protein